MSDLSNSQKENSDYSLPLANEYQMQNMIATNQPEMQPTTPEHNEEVLSHQEVFDILVRSSTYYFRKELFWLPLVRRFSQYLQKEALP